MGLLEHMYTVRNEQVPFDQRFAMVERILPNLNPNEKF